MSGITELSVEEERLGIWIDAVCINQSDVEERNLQVKRMRDIYKQAAGAIVWLGKAADDSDKAMDLLDSVAKHQFNTREEVATYMASIRENPNVFAPGSWKALHDFLSRPYWTRLWVIQEIALSFDSLNVVCGNREINWPFLYGAISAFSIDIEAVISAAKLEYNAIGFETADESVIMDGMNRIQHLGLFRDAEAAGLGRPDLKHLLAISRGAKQKDPKDKVYGILSLVDPSLSELITPDYGASTSEVFIDFAKAAITSTGSLDITTNRGKPHSSEQALPSWVPDWTEEQAVRIEMTMKVPYQASKNSMVIKFENEYLLTRGFTIDKVDGLGVDFWTDEEVEDIVQPVHKENPYGDNASIRDALWRTLVANRDAAGEVAPDSYKDLLEVPWIDEDTAEYSPSDSVFLDNFHLMRIFNGELQLGSRNFKSYFPPETDKDSPMPTWTGSLDPLHRVYSVVCGRKLIITAKGYFGLAAKTALQDDIICILLGCTVPVILRPSADGSSYRVVGESYIHGFMDGEAMDGLKAGQYSLEDFTIS